MMFMRIGENVCGKLIKRILCLMWLEMFEDVKSYKTVNDRKN